MQVKRQTLSNRLHGQRSKMDASVSQQVLSPTQEAVIVDWCGHQATVAKPFNPDDLRSIAFNMTGKIPGKNWHRRFELQHPELKRTRPSNLDLKHAKNFNETNVTNYYDLVRQLKEEYPNLPPEHMWNMDEKGIQLGGGHKNSGKKYYKLASIKGSNFYRIKSDSLELVTVIECISAAGAAISPTFILSDKGQAGHQ